MFVARSSCSPQFHWFFCLCVLIRVPCLLVFQHSLAGIFPFGGSALVGTRVLRMARKGARTILDKAPIMNGKKEWLCRVCKTSTVWTRKKCTICDECQRSLSSSTSGPLTCNRMCGMICLHVRNVCVQWQHSTESQSNKDEDRRTNTGDSRHTCNRRFLGVHGR